jgi:hypothetical protein
LSDFGRLRKTLTDFNSRENKEDKDF